MTSSSADAPYASNGPKAPRATRRELVAWALYDWANSAHSTISITILLFYIQHSVFPAQTWGNTGPVVWAWGISASMLVAAILSPILGAVADAHASKRHWLGATALTGAAAALLLALTPTAAYVLVVALFVGMTLMFELSLGFYNGFLPELADERTMNRVSAWGYGLGYIGGGVALILALIPIFLGESLGLGESGQHRWGMAVMGLWWGGFTLPVISVLRDRGPARKPSHTLPQATREAVGEVGRTLSHIRDYKFLAVFLLAFLFYNDGVQTVVSQSPTFATQDLQFEDHELVLLVLLIQFLAMPGALLVGRVADWLQPKPTLLICLGIWMGMLATAYFITSKPAFWGLGVLLALVMGGTQSVSRSIMGLMTPERRTAEFFGFFNLSGKATSFLGTFLFGLIVGVTGSARLAVLSLLAFFFVGALIALRVDITAGRAQVVRENAAAEPS